jgi:hypothetical protein
MIAFSAELGTSRDAMDAARSDDLAKSAASPQEARKQST